MPNTNRSCGVKCARYALVHNGDRATSNGGAAPGQPASIVGQASPRTRRLRWIGSRPYHAPDTGIIGIFRAPHSATSWRFNSTMRACASANLSLLCGKNNLRKNRNRSSLKRWMLVTGNSVTIVVEPASASRSRQLPTHSITRSGAAPYNKSFPMSVTSAAVGSAGRACKSRQSAQGKIPEIFLPKTVESWPYERPCPIAAMISSGSPHVRRAAATTVGNDSDRLLAPNRITRRSGALLFDELFKTGFASRPSLAAKTPRRRLSPGIPIILQRLKAAEAQEAKHDAQE
jgi:hypothetical protein